MPALDHLLSTSLLAQAAGGGLLSLLPLVLILTLGYFMFVLPQKQKDKRYQEMVASIKERDHVLTTGGVFGVVTSVQREQERVTLRIDDASGAKMRVAMWAISGIIKDDQDALDASVKDNKK